MPASVTVDGVGSGSYLDCFSDADNNYIVSILMIS